jgi:predicted acyl esterase
MLFLKRHPRPWRLVLAILLALSVTPATTSAALLTGPPKAFDYLQVKNLSKARYDYATEVNRTVTELDVGDGVKVYLEVTRPKFDDRRYPTILEASPYHGTLADREGTRILPEPRDENAQSLGLTRYFAPRGYAVVMMDLRGTGRSGGCLDHIGPNDRADLKKVIDWIAAQPWSNGRVGMTGHSYVGSTPSAAAAMRPAALKTIVPSAGLATMYDHQFQAGVPFFLQWAGPMEAYEQLTFERYLPDGDSFGKNLEYAGCGLPNSSLVAGEDQLSGRYAAWHAARDWEKAATNAPIPVFMVHGVNDNAARVTGMEWFTERGGRVGDKLWLGQWDHGSGCCPTRRGLQWTYALHAWFDKHLAQRNVDTGPPVELFLSKGSFQGARTGDRAQVLVTDRWPVANATYLTLYPAASAVPGADGSLSPGQPLLPGTASFTGDPTGFNDPQATGGVDFVSDAMATDTVLAGQPLLDLVASVTVPRVHVIANLYDEFPDGSRRRISQFAINPELRNGIDTLTPVVPGVPMTLRPPGFAMAHNLVAGHKLVLRVTASDPDKVPTFAVDPMMTVYTGRDGTGTVLRVPVVANPPLATDDVPLQVLPKKPGDAQATVKGSVTPLLTGPQPLPGVNTAYFEFDVLERNDNNTMIVGAVPELPADIDLYLQKQQADGSWGPTIITGGSPELTHEGFVLSQPADGHYRLEAHNWAGLPATRVDVTITFLNSEGDPAPTPPSG